MVDDKFDNGTLSSAMANDGASSLPSQTIDERGKEAKELDELYEHADPRMADNTTEDGERAKTDRCESEKVLSEADEQATTFERSL